MEHCLLTDEQNSVVIQAIKSGVEMLYTYDKLDRCEYYNNQVQHILGISDATEFYSKLLELLQELRGELLECIN